MSIRPLIAANWKMYKRPSEAAAWMKAFLEKLEQVEIDSAGTDHAEIVVCAPATHLAVLGNLTIASPVILGAQDVSAHAEGAYTGEVSASMLEDLGVEYVIVGHSERREYHREDDALVNAKLRCVLDEGMRPILCVGETLEQREAGSATAVVMGQLEAGLAGVGLQNPDELVVAYEPVWAIGTGKTATTADAQEMCAAIRATLKELVGSQAGDLRVLYGGSMKPANAEELLRQPDVNGGLIGSASLDVDSLLAIVEAARA